MSFPGVFKHSKKIRSGQSVKGKPERNFSAWLFIQRLQSLREEACALPQYPPGMQALRQSSFDTIFPRRVEAGRPLQGSACLIPSRKRRGTPPTDCLRSGEAPVCAYGNTMPEIQKSGAAAGSTGERGRTQRSCRNTSRQMQARPRSGLPIRISAKPE